MMTVTALSGAQGAAEYLSKDGFGDVLGEGKTTAGEYYTNNNDQDATRWHGKLAEELGLVSTDKQTLENTLRGQLPDGTQLPVGPTGERAPGWDATFSAPKSVSIQGLVGGDDRVIKAHDEAVKSALDKLEERLTTRIKSKGSVEQVNTGKMAAFTVRHDTSRELEPQLHTHSAIMNMTMTEDGKIRSLNSQEIYQAQKELGELYRRELADRLEKAGYELDRTVDKKGVFNFEIKGVNEEVRNEFSSRSQQVEAYLEEKGLTRATATAEQKEAATLATRKGKEVPENRQKLQQDWKSQAQAKGHDADRLAQQAKDRAANPSYAKELDQKRIDIADREVFRSIEKKSANDAVITENDIIKDVLARAPEINADQVKAALDRLEEKGDVTSKTITDKEHQLFKREQSNNGEGEPTKKMILAYKRAYKTNPVGLNFAQVRDALNERQDVVGFMDPVSKGNYVGAVGADGKTTKTEMVKVYSTKTQIARELADIGSTKRLVDPRLERNQGMAIMSREQAAMVVSKAEQAAEKAGHSMNEQQKSAVLGILSDKQQMHIVQGYAGTAKTSAVLKVVTKTMQENNYTVVAAAPTTDAAAKLQQETNADSFKTLQMLVLERKMEDLVNKNGRPLLEAEKQKWRQGLQKDAKTNSKIADAYQKKADRLEAFANDNAVMGLNAFHGNLDRIAEDMMNGKRGKGFWESLNKSFERSTRFNEAYRTANGDVYLKRPFTTFFAGGSKNEKATLTEIGTGLAESQRADVQKTREKMLEKSQEFRAKAADMKALSESLTDAANGKSRDVVILDEASLAETKHFAALKAYSEISGSRLIGTGDDKQHGSVGAGESLRQTKEATRAVGGSVHELTIILRQSNEDLKKAVYDTVEANAAEAIKKVQHGGAGTVVEIGDRAERRERLANDYVAMTRENRDKTIIVDPARESGRLLSDSIRDKLKENGELKNEKIYDVFDSKRLEESEYKFADRYKVGDVLRDRKSGNLIGVVKAADKKTNMLKIEQNGRTTERNANTIDQRKTDVGTILKTGFAEGDKIRMNAKTKLGNKGSYAKVVGHTDKGLRVEDVDGKRHTISPDQMRDATHGYVTTSHKSQGQTVDRVMINMDSAQRNLSNLQTLYVALSRAKIEARLYTDDAVKLADTVSKNTGASGSAIEVKQKTFVVMENVEKNSEEYKDIEAEAKKAGGLLITVSEDGEIKSVRNFEGEIKKAEAAKEVAKTEATVDKAAQLYQAVFNKSADGMTTQQVSEALNSKRSEIKELADLVKELSKAKAIQEKEALRREGPPTEKMILAYQKSYDKEPPKEFNFGAVRDALNSVKEKVGEIKKIEDGKPTERMASLYESFYGKKTENMTFGQVRDELIAKKEQIGDVGSVLKLNRELSAVAANEKSNQFVAKGEGSQRNGSVTDKVAEAYSKRRDGEPTVNMMIAYERNYERSAAGLNFGQVRDALNEIKEKVGELSSLKGSPQAKSHFKRDPSTKSPDRTSGKPYKRDATSKSPARDKATSKTKTTKGQSPSKSESIKSANNDRDQSISRTRSS